MDLLKTFTSLIAQWEESFSNPQAFQRAQDHALANLCSSPPHTLTSIIAFNGTDCQDFSADYKLYSRAKWTLQDLFSPVLKEATSYFKGDYITVSGDDTAHPKTGKHIETARYQRDPMSPPFHANLLFGIRFLILSLTLPLYQIEPHLSARGIPIDYKEAPIAKKPGYKATDKEKEEYKKLKAQMNLSYYLLQEIADLRKRLDEIGLYKKDVLLTLDGAFCNRTCLRQNIDRMYRIVRCRKDIKLYKKAKKEDKNRFYDPVSLTPEEIYKDSRIPWIRTLINRAGRYRRTYYKEVKNVYWKNATLRKPYNLIVIKKVRYKPRKGRISEREPGYLLNESLNLSAKQAIQAYFDHGQIELNIKEGKSLGAGQAYVRNEKSVSRQPAFVISSYSTLLFAGVKTYQDKWTPQLGRLPKWRKKVRRPSIRMLIRQLKKEVLYEPSLIEALKLAPKAISLLLRIAL